MNNNGESLLRTDLAIESIESIKDDSLTSSVEEKDGIKVTTVVVSKDMEKLIEKKNGTYITVEYDDITDFHNRKNLGNVLTRELNKLFVKVKIKDNYECLIIGLGNVYSTADALGPLTINNILVTRHLFTLDFDVKQGMRSVSAISPGVMGQTGIETSEIIQNLVNTVKPDFILVIDSLKASSVSRVNKTIQITDTGIAPGSGVGNKRKEISSSIFKIPVIAIGIPTVVDASTIVNDTINLLYKHISYIKHNESVNKLIYRHFNNYGKRLEKTNDLSKREKENLLGMVGSLDNEEKIELLKEVLDQTNYNLIVTPKEIDFLVEKLSKLLANSINRALHREIKEDSIFL